MCQTQTTTSDLPIYNIVVPEKVFHSKNFDDAIACDLCFGPTPQSKILAMPMAKKYYIFYIKLRVAH